MRASSLNKRGILAPAAAVAIVLMAAGCGPQYEIDRPGTWRPTGANEYNLRAMVADRRDLTAGASTTTDRGGGAARAVTRLYTDRRRPLLDVSLSKIAPSSSASQDSSGGAGLGGGGAAATGGAPQ